MFRRGWGSRDTGSVCRSAGRGWRMPPGEGLLVRLQGGLRAVELVVEVQIELLRLSVHAHVDARDRRGELAERVVQVLRNLAQRVDKLRAVPLDRGLDAG